MKENKVSREYKYWDKYLSKYEKKGITIHTHLLPRVQIERCRKKLTEEQLAELLERYDNLGKSAFDRYIAAKAIPVVVVNQYLQK